jgi:mannosyltransferase
MPATHFLARVRPANASLWLLAIICAGAFLLRCVGLTGRWLWYDELLSVNFSAHGPWAALLSALRFDVHPPLYYLQLSLWALPSRGDVWLMLNTVVWSTAAVASLAYCAKRIYGWPVGLVAGLLLAVAPAALAYSDQVRMYSLLMVLTIWAWYAQVRWLDGNTAKLDLLALVASQLAVIYTHSAGLVMLSGPVLFGFVSALGTHRRDDLVRWFLAQALVAALALPAVAIALLRAVEHTRLPSLGDVIGTWSFLVTGNLDLAPWAIAFAGLVTALLAVWAYFDKHLRLLLGTLVAAPLLIAIVVSYALKPMWLERVFITIVPFICLAIALALTPRAEERLRVKERWVAVLAFAVIWAAVGFTQQLSRTKGDGFKPAAALVHSLTGSGDLVLVDDHFSYWSFLWYYAGPDWGRPQRAYLLNDKWAGLTKRFPALWGRLGFSAADTKVERQGVAVLLWDRTRPAPSSAGNIIAVRIADAPPISVPGRRKSERFVVGQLIIERWAP